MSLSIHASATAVAAVAKPKAEHDPNPAKQAKAADPAVKGAEFGALVELPGDEAVHVSLRTQQILAYETGIARTADPLGGSFFVESLTDQLEQRIH